MKNLVLSSMTCGFVLFVCLIAVVIMVVAEGTIASATVVGHGTCTTGTLDRAGDRAGLRNNLRRDNTVLTLTCNGGQYVTAQGEVITAWYRARTDRLYCEWRANGVADCRASTLTEAAK